MSCTENRWKFKYKMAYAKTQQQVMTVVLIICVARLNESLRNERCQKWAQRK